MSRCICTIRPVSLSRLTFGGSLMRPEATGYGLVYFLEEMLSAKNDALKARWTLGAALRSGD